MSKIQWTDETWNPIVGCTKIDPACANCYAVRQAYRNEAMGKALEAQGKNPGKLAQYYGVSDGKNWTGKLNLYEPAMVLPDSWRKPRRIFVNSMSDLFHENLPAVLTQDVLDVVRDVNHHRYQVLTKRPHRMESHLYDNCDPLEFGHCIFGCSVGTQSTADKFGWPMEKLAGSGFKTWVSAEPLLGPVDFSGWEFLDWIVIGGESGPGARRFDISWARQIIGWAKANNIPVFFKQWGAKPTPLTDSSRKGDNFEVWPQHLQIRQYPEALLV
jgi:protein gp37